MSNVLGFLESLIARPEWRPSELPKAITLDALRVLDRHQLVEFKTKMLGWYTPATMHGVGGPLETALKEGYPLRVSGHGKARLAELRLEQTGADDFPPFNPESPEWIKATDAAERESVTVHTLRTYRKNGRVFPGGLRGIDPDGRKWAKANANAHVYYVKSSLRRVVKP